MNCSNRPLCVRVADALTRIPIILITLILLTACQSKKQLSEELSQIDLSTLRALSLFDTTFIFAPSLNCSLTNNPNHPSQSQTLPGIKIIRHANLTEKTQTKEHKQAKTATQQAQKKTNPADGYIRYSIIFLIILISISVVCFIIRLTKFLV